jgi:hypothetical protein
MTTDEQSLILFWLTFAIVTAVLVWGLWLLQKTLAKEDGGQMFMSKALTEKAPTTSAAPGNPPAPAPEVPSYSRVAAAVGTFVLATMVLGMGYYALWSLFTRNTVDLSSVGSYLLSGSALFAPYAFNQLSSIFKK